MSGSVTIRVPLDPPAALFPNRRNRRGGFHDGIRAAADARQASKLTAIQYATSTAIAGPVSVTIRAGYGHGRKTPDLDATLSACKPMLDGLVDGGILVDDRQISRITVEHEKLSGTRPQGWTDITIEEITQP